MSAHIETLRRLIIAWQAKDIERVLDFMTDDIVWSYAAPALPPVRGKPAAARLLRRFQADMHDVRWRIFRHAESGDTLFVEGVDEYHTAEGRRMATPYAGVLEFRDGRICGWRDYVDLAVIEAQRGGAPFPAHIEALLDR